MEISPTCDIEGPTEVTIDGAVVLCDLGWSYHLPHSYSMVHPHLILVALLLWALLPLVVEPVVLSPVVLVLS